MPPIHLCKQEITDACWPDFGRMGTRNAAACCVPVSSIPAGQWTYGLLGNMPETLYGSDA